MKLTSSCKSTFLQSWLMCLVLLSSLPSLSSAWGEFGHEIVANLAWRRLSSTTQHKIATILNITNATLIDETGSPMAAVANWADHVRHFLPWSAELHYIDIRDNLITGGCHYPPKQQHDALEKPACSCDFKYDRDCPEDICVAGAILNYSTQLLSYTQKPTQPPSLRRDRGKGQEENTPQSLYRMQQALKFLIHFIGDIHQPLHASRTTDKGGNDIDVQYHLLHKQYPVHVRHGNRTSLTTTVEYNNTLQHHHHTHHHSWNLHSIWDTALIETALERDYDNQRSKMEEFLEALLQQHPEWIDHYASCSTGSGGEAAMPASGLNNTCVIEWGQESWIYALEYAYTKNEPWKDHHTPPVEVADGDVLGEDYYQTRIAVFNERLIAGGVRLAMTLEDIFRGDNTINASANAQDISGSSVLSLWSKLLVGRRR